jgi:quinol monooxygenase YgiN
MKMVETGDGAEGPISTLVEWQAPRLTPQEAEQIASKTIRMIGRLPGFVEGRFFGDFESGTHYYLLTWESRAALDAYAASEQMLGVREIAAPFVEGRPTRKILRDYTERG